MRTRLTVPRLILTAIVAVSSLQADVRLPSVLSDHMMLQRGIPVRIWGKADPGEAVSIVFRNQKVEAQADSIGRWAAYLAPLEAGGPFELTVKGRNTITLKDVLVGDVWIASGQSNMAWTVGRSDNAEKEIAAADYPRIRLFKVGLKAADYPLDDVSGSWAPCSPQSVRDFSGVGYFFGRHLHQNLKVPVGVIQTAWGGTPAESWTSEPALTADPALSPLLLEWAKAMRDYPEANARYEIRLKEWEASAKAQGQAAPRKPAPPQGPGHQWMPAGLFNAMIAPLTPYGIKGAIWYQGESNANRKRAGLYRRLFTTMIEDWRRAWGQGDFPFFFVQLANFKPGADAQWPELREAQLETLALRNTGMAVTIDIGNPSDIHPTNKQDVGLRLALAARSVAYGEKLVFSGPVFRQLSAETVNDGKALRAWFDHTGAGLTAKGGTLKGFEIAGANGKFVPAEARIEKHTVVVSSPEVKDPVAVRYAWADVPDCNLYNSEGLPASPFRTDGGE